MRRATFTAPGLRRPTGCLRIVVSIGSEHGSTTRRALIVNRHPAVVDHGMIRGSASSTGRGRLGRGFVARPLLHGYRERNVSGKRTARASTGRSGGRDRGPFDGLAYRARNVTFTVCQLHATVDTRGKQI